MAKSFNVSFNINGSLDGSLQAALRAAANSMRGLGNAARAASASAAASRSGLAGMAAGLNQLQQAAAKFRELKKALAETQRAMDSAQSSVNSLARKSREDERAVEALRQKLSQLRETQKKNENATATSRGTLNALRQQRAELKAMLKDLGVSGKKIPRELLGTDKGRRVAELLTSLSANKAALEAQRNQFRALGEEAKKLATSIRETQTALKSQEQAARQSGRGFEDAKAKAQALKESLRQQQEALQRLRTSLGSQGFSTSSFAASERQLAAEIDRVNAALRQQQALMQARSRFNESATNLAVAGAGMMGAVYTAEQIAQPFQSAAENAMNFEYAMSKVKSLTQMRNIRSGNLEQVREEMAALTKQAEELGATTEFTSQEVAEAMGFYGMAGWDTKRIQNAMKSTIDLATIAGDHNIQRMADVLSDDMTAMGLKAGEMITLQTGKQVESSKYFADAFAYALTNANVNRESLHEALKYNAPIAKQWGLTMGEEFAMNMMSANAGIKGSMAGTGLRAGLLRISAPPKKAAAAFAEMGLSMSDAQKELAEGQAAMKAYGVTIGDFKTTLTSLSEVYNNLSRGERLGFVDAVFGKNASSFWANILDKGNVADVLKAASEIDTGFVEGWAADTASVMRDNTKTSVELLKSSLDALQKSIGEALTPAIRAAADAFSPMVTAAANFVAANPAIVQAAASIAAALATIVVGAAAVKLAFAGWGFITSSIELVRKALAGLAGTSVLSSVATSISAVGAALMTAGRAAMALAFSPVGAVLLAIALAGLWCYQNWDKVAPVLSNIAGIISGALGPAITQVQTALSALSSSGGFSALSAAASQLASVIGGTLVKAFAVLLTVAAQVIATVIQLFADLITLSVDFGTGLFDAFSKISEGDFSGAFDSLKSTAFKTFGDIKQMGSHVMDGVVNGAENVKSVLDALSASQVEMGASKVATGVTSGITQAANMVAPEAQPLDTSATQAALDQVGDSASNAATNMDGVNQATQQISQAGTDVQAFSQTAQQAGTGVQQFSTNAQQAATTAQTFSTSAQQAAAGSDALGMSAQNATGGIEALSASAANAVGGVSNLGSAASSAAGSVSGLGAAVQAACSQLASAGASAAAAVASAAPKANYKGGIYKKGAFLTTFAEKSPEAAIPIENSNRARELWTKTGQMLGILPGDAGNYDSATGQTEIQRQAIEITRAARQQHVMQQLGRRRVPTASSQRRLSQAEHNRQLREQVLSGQKSLDAAINEVQLPSGATIGDALKHLPTSKSKPILPQENRNARVNIPMITTPPFAPQDSPITGGRKNIPMITTPPVVPTNRGTFNDTPTSSGFTALGNILDGLGGFGKIFGKSGTGLGSAFGGFSSLGSIGGLIDGLTGNKSGSGIFGAGLSELGSLGDLTGTIFNSNAGQSSEPSSFNVTINVTVNGNADENTVRNGVEAALPALDDWRRQWQEHQHDAARRSFA